MNSKIVSIKRFSAIFLAIVLFTGTIAISSSTSFMRSAQAQPYYYDRIDDNNYQKSYGKDNYKYTKDSSIVDINKIKCINDNININGQNTRCQHW